MQSAAGIKGRIHRLRDYPNADPSLTPYFQNLLTLAGAYFHDTGQHLNVYDDIGDSFGAIMYGIKLPKNYVQRSEGRLGNDFVEIKTISPSNGKEQTSVRLDRHFSKLLIVKIGDDSEVSGRLVKRAELSKRAGNNLRLSWANTPEPQLEK